MIKRKVFSRFAALTLICCSLLASCKDADTPDDTPDDTPGDAFSGSITPGADNNDGQQQPTVDEGDENATYYIATADDLRAMKRKGTYVLTADIDISDGEWTPVGTYATPFVGTFDGAGFTVSGLTVTKAEKDAGDCLTYGYTYVGLFGCTDGATVKNLKLENININVSSAEDYRVIYAGAIAGNTADTEITDCSVISGSITAQSTGFKAYTGGAVGFSFSTVFTRCSVSADISAIDSKENATAGSITAYLGAKSELSGCESNGSVSAVSTKGNAYAGGITGYLYNSSVSKCTASSSVSASTVCNESEKGTVGAALAGGIAAFSGGFDKNTATISVSVSTGSVSASSLDYSAYAGGITAKQTFTAITESYSRSAVSASSNLNDGFAGGITAQAASGSIMNGVFFSGSITVKAKNNDAYFGALVGFDSTTNLGENGAKLVTDKCGYLQLSELSLTVNGNSASGETLEKLLLHGSAYSSSLLRNRTNLTDYLGWNADNWSFSLQSFPTVAL